MSYFGGGGQNGGNARGPGGNAGQATLLTGPQLFVNSANQLQFQGAGPGQNYFSQGDSSQNQLGPPLLLQPPTAAVNFVTDQLGIGLITQAAAGGIMNLGSVLQEGPGAGQSKQRVFTGMVTKIHDNFGFIDEEVFFQMGVVKGPILPKEGDRVLVEADYNPSMPFKWNATRVQIVNMGGCSSSVSQAQGYQSYSSKQVPPPPNLGSSGGGRNSGQGMVSNSMYSSGNTRSSGLSSEMSGSNRRSTASHMMSDLSQGMSLSSLPSLLSKRESSPRERDRDRDRDRDRGRERLRSRSKERRRERSRSRDRERPRRSRSRSRERRVRRSPSPPSKRKLSPLPRERVRERERSLDRKDRERERSPKPKSERVKRSRSRDTIKSSEGKGRDKSRSPSREKRLSKTVAVKPARYTCDAPKFSLDTLELNPSEMKLRYKNLYIPSDFFLAKACWMDAFPLTKPFQLSLTSSLAHIMGRRVERVIVNFEDEQFRASQDKFLAVPNNFYASDSSCTFSVKVMLMSAPSLDTIFKKSGFVLDDERQTGESKESKDLAATGLQGLQRLLNFVVGVKSGKHDIMALGGHWSPSLDGPNPQSDPHVLVNTAIRCCKALASLDLTRCKLWYRFMEVYYRRSNGNLETVVYFLPDLTSCVPTAPEWDSITKAYSEALYGPGGGEKGTSTTLTPAARAENGPSPGSHPEPGPAKDARSTSTVEKVEEETWEPAEEDASDLRIVDSVDEIEQQEGETGMEVVDECNGDVEEGVKESKDGEIDIYEDIVETHGLKAAETAPLEIPTPTQSGLTSMTVAKLREELTSRSLNTKGLKAQLVARLQEALNAEKVELQKASVATKETESEAVIKQEKSDQDEEPILKVVEASKIMEPPCSEEKADKTPEAKGEEKNEKLEVQGFSWFQPTPKGQLVYPVLKPEMSSDDRKLWERRFALSKQPKVLVFPATKISSSSSSLKKTIGSFDCSLMPLNSLRDYRHIDNREESFEVSLFSEFFYEMLQRDFGFRVYIEVAKRAKMADGKSTKKEVQEPGESEETSKDGEPSAKRKKASTPTGSETSKEKTKTVDPLLLLAFTFFDEHQTGYVAEEDVEEIIASLGLALTRHEIQKMVRKVTTKGCLFYRKWTDKTESELAEAEKDNDQSLLAIEDSKMEPDFLEKLALGNKNLLPVFTYSNHVVEITDDSINDTSGGENSPALNEKEALLVTVNGETVDLNQLRSQLETSEKEKLAAEANSNVLKISLTEAKNQVSELKKSNDSLSEELKKCKDTIKKLDVSEKTNKEMLDIFKKSTESFIYRVKGMVKLPHSHGDEKKGSDKDKEKSKGKDQQKESKDAVAKNDAEGGEKENSDDKK